MKTLKFPTVSLALHSDAIVPWIAKKTYGTSVISPVDPKLDPSQFLKATNGVENCRSRFDVFVRKGSPVEVDMCVTKKYEPCRHGQSKMMFDRSAPVSRSCGILRGRV